MSNIVTVQISFTERVRYSAVVEMDVEKFDELDHALDNTRGADLRRVEESIVELCSIMLSMLKNIIICNIKQNFDLSFFLCIFLIRKRFIKYDYENNYLC